jgi:glycosyltransferase involved in cell wall biosynthesis
LFPFVSVIIPLRNEEKRISECIESVIRQSYPHKRFELLLVDGQSEDNTRPIIESYCRKYEFIRFLDNPRRIVPVALNLGIKSAQGEIIVRMDAHAYYQEDYIAKCVETLRNVEADNVGGPIETLPGDNTPVAQAIAFATSHPFGVGNSKFRTSRVAEYVDTITFGAFRRTLFDKIGFFNEKLARNQDIEFNSRIINNGGKIFLNPEIRSFYYNRTTLKGLWEQNFKNGMWNIFTLSLNRKSLSLRHFVPFFFVVSLLITLASAPLTSLGFVGFGIVIASYLIANLYFSFTINTASSPKVIKWLPLVFAALHISYGFGSMLGLARVLNWKSQLAK